MKEELEQEIINIAPYLFHYEGWDNPHQSLIGFGFECGEGWFKLLKDLVIKLKEYDINKQIKVQQVKEKWGELRFYVCYGDDPREDFYNKINDIISVYEELSSRTCEYCGEPGTINGRGWLKCTCSKCNKEDK
jgi:hypothetical protein